MAIYTSLDLNQIAAFWTRYGRGTLATATGILEGVENTNYHLTTTDGTSYILTLFEARTNAADLPFFVGVMQGLAALGLACPAPLADTSGQIAQQLAGKAALITSFLPGRPAPALTAAHLHNAGAMLGRLHNAATQLPPSLSRPNGMGPAYWPTLAKKCLASAPAVYQPALTSTLHTLTGAWPTNLPAGVVHADFFPDNVFFSGTACSGVIDFYFACTDFFAYDLAITLNAWCFTGNDWDFFPDHFLALLAGYQQQRALSAPERAALPTLLAGAALRFLLSRLHDVLYPQTGSVVAKNPAEYLHKLTFWQKEHRQISALLAESAP